METLHLSILTQFLNESKTTQIWQQAWNEKSTFVALHKNYLHDLFHIFTRSLQHLTSDPHLYNNVKALVY